ncbi:PilN domain-containing protein [Bacillus pinisoli]|uniref:PilN domain-containing protein n=1 Tax=Bacillus pinisoli TaxID=2901866 RepID=UPI001FF5B2E3|nr:hypothetical protein [Bacillus pinisoli]
MLIDINLLPKKELKNFASVVLIIVPILLLFVLIGLFFVQKNEAQQQIEALQDSVHKQQQLKITYEQKLASFEISESVDQLEQTIEWMDATSVKSVPILEHLTALLPQRGYISTYSYSDQDRMQLTIQFDTSIESAYYLKELKDSDYFSEAKIISLLTNPYLENTDQIVIKENVTNETYIPRYVAVYDLSLNIPSILELQREGE